MYMTILTGDCLLPFLISLNIVAKSTSMKHVLLPLNAFHSLNQGLLLMVSILLKAWLPGLGTDYR